MQRSRVLTAFQRAAVPFIAAIFVAVIMLAVVMVPCGRAQEASPVPSAPSAQMQTQKAMPSSSQPFDVKQYSKPESHFPNLIAPYTARHVAPPNLANTSRIDQLMHDGKLYISMNDAVALALENNLDIAIARYNLNIADTDIWRAKAGASTLGVNNGVVQNTPGGGVGGLGAQVGSGQGGTSVAAGGAGTGAGGLVQSTFGSGPQITSFDPILTGTLQVDHNSILASSAFSPASGVDTTTGSFSYQQGFQWGTNLSVGFNNQRQTIADAPFQLLSPQLNSSFNFRLTQHLLQGFGFAPNTRFIEIAKNNREISDVAFRLQITTTVDQIENMYWDLVYAYENVRVQKEQLAFAQKTLSDNQKQVEIGTLAPIEVVRAQSTVASNQQHRGGRCACSLPQLPAVLRDVNRSVVSFSRSCDGPRAMSLKVPVIPAEAGIQNGRRGVQACGMDSRFRGNDLTLLFYITRLSPRNPVRKLPSVALCHTSVPS